MKNHHYCVFRTTSTNVGQLGNAFPWHNMTWNGKINWKPLYKSALPRQLLMGRPHFVYITGCETTSEFCQSTRCEKWPQIHIGSTIGQRFFQHNIRKTRIRSSRCSSSSSGAGVAIAFAWTRGKRSQSTQKFMGLLRRGRCTNGVGSQPSDSVQLVLRFWLFNGSRAGWAAP